MSSPASPQRSHRLAPTAKHPSRQPWGHRPAGPNPSLPSPSPGSTCASREPDVGSRRQQHPIAKRNPADSQQDFQIPSDTSPIQVQLCLPTQVSKPQRGIQKGILFPTNNYSVSVQPSLPTLKTTNITNAGKSSGSAARRLKSIRPQVTDLHPESRSSSWVSSYEAAGVICTLFSGMLRAQPPNYAQSAGSTQEIVKIC